MRALLLAGLLILAGVGPLAGQFVRIMVLDVGQGDALLVTTPNGRFVLVDAGQDGWLADSLVSQYKVGRLDLVIGSHRHRDHVGGLDEVIRRIPTARLIWDATPVPGRAFDDDLRSAARARSVPMSRPRVDTVTVDSVRFIAMRPTPRASFSEENDNSIVVRIEYGEFSFLSAGDIEKDGRDWLVRNVPHLLDADVLKASHHGSHNGTSESWLRAVSPERVVISAGVRADYRHPHAVAVAAYEAATDRRVYCTNRVSTVRVYGYRSGSTRITVKLPANLQKSCAYDGTRY